ncbi:50S ribosomal protein l20 chloroplastic [Phtheirospermum japonicum]|uniref:Large ribosomal subunit protein bL20c n=1 Tax=Phtheirospermum japonicum TaxID=374723 RepID=A0A830BSQ0_9LAMI|nr:50S ribosomal protein l20 chloroplastic [Phtheirospermum japonicum]
MYQSREGEGTILDCGRIGDGGRVHHGGRRKRRIDQIKRRYIARRRRTQIHLFASSFRGAHSRLTRTITQQKTRVLVSAHRDRDKQKKNFHRLCIARINALGLGGTCLG